MKSAYDTIIIGSGIGGLACASALAKCGHKVLVLEQHFLAGGLTPANVADAVAAVEPFGLDLCSSVRTDDRLDEHKLRAFFAAIPG